MKEHAEVLTVLARTNSEREPWRRNSVQVASRVKAGVAQRSVIECAEADEARLVI
jgi:hypothetical protein